MKKLLLIGCAVALGSMHGAPQPAEALYIKPTTTVTENHCFICETIVGVEENCAEYDGGAVMCLADEDGQCEALGVCPSSKPGYVAPIGWGWFGWGSYNF